MICLYVITGFVYERDYCDCVISDVLEWHAGIDVEWGCVGLEILYKSVRWESSQVMTIYPFTEPPYFRSDVVDIPPAIRYPLDDVCANQLESRQGAWYRVCGALREPAD